MNLRILFLQIIIVVCSASALNSYAKTNNLNTNLVVIQNVANDSMSFVIRKGRVDSIVKDQVSMFSTKKISFTARAVAITNEYSQWLVSDNRIKVPFEKGQIVTVNYSPERVWLEIPKMMGDKNYQEMLAKEEASLKERQFQRFDNRIELYYGKYRGLSESTTDSTNNDTARVSDSFILQYSIPFDQMFHAQVGIRYDNDLLSLNSPFVEQESTRIMGTAALKIQFNSDWNYRFNYFITIGAGIGVSESEIQNATKSGMAVLLPAVSLGLEYKITPKKALIFKLNFDALQANEAFEDVEQTTDMTMMGLSVGYAF